MAECKKIVVLAIDPSKQALKAVDFYLGHLHQPGNMVVLAHVVDLPDISQQAYLSSHALSERCKEQGGKAEKLERKYLKYLRSRGLTHVKFRTDGGQKPGKVICEIANEEEATLVVIGTRGMGKIRRTLLGSVSDYVVHHAPCPVVVCRNTEPSVPMEDKDPKRGSMASMLSEVSLASEAKAPAAGEDVTINDEELGTDK